MPISPLPWKAVQAANIPSECWIIEDANGKAVAVAENVMLDMHLGWTQMSRENVEAIVCAVNNMEPLLQACKRALVDGTELHGEVGIHSYAEPLRAVIRQVLDTWALVHAPSQPPNDPDGSKEK